MISLHPHKHDHAQCVKSALARAADLCARRGEKLTPPRQRVLQIVWDSHQPIGAYDILRRMTGPGSKAPPTVYRALEFLIGQGLVHRIESLNAYIGCPTPDQDHAGQFLICRHCHAALELRDGELGLALRRRAEQEGFRVERQTVEIVGLCPDCQTPEGGRV